MDTNLKKKPLVVWLLPCPLCGTEFSSTEEMNMHKKRCDDNSAHTCTVCQRVFKVKCTLIQHMRIHTTEYRSKCVLCDEEMNVEDFEKHQCPFKRTTVNGDPKLRCYLCDTPYSTQKEFDAHRKIYAMMNSPHVCVMCNKRYRVRCTLIQHMRVHDTVNMLKCCDCDSIFSLTDFEKHKQEFLLGSCAPYKCTHCEQSFKTETSRSTHVQEKHEHWAKEKLYVCFFCSTKFYTMNQLDQHTATACPIATKELQDVKQEKDEVLTDSADETEDASAQDSSFEPQFSAASVAHPEHVFTGIVHPSTGRSSIRLPKLKRMEPGNPKFKGIEPTSPCQKNTDSASMQVNPNKVQVQAPKMYTIKANTAYTQRIPNMHSLLNGEAMKRAATASAQMTYRAAKPVPVGSVRPATSPVTYPDSRHKKNNALFPPPLIHKPSQDSQKVVIIPPSLIRKPSQYFTDGQSSRNIATDSPQIIYRGPIEAAPNMSLSQNEKRINIANITKPLISGTGLRPHTVSSITDKTPTKKTNFQESKITVVPSNQLQTLLFLDGSPVASIPSLCAEKTSLTQNRQRVISKEFAQLVAETSTRTNTGSSNMDKTHGNPAIYKIVRNPISGQQSKIKVVSFDNSNNTWVENVQQKIIGKNVTRNVDATQQEVNAFQSKLVKIAPKKTMEQQNQKQEKDVIVIDSADETEDLSPQVSSFEPQLSPTIMTHPARVFSNTGAKHPVTGRGGIKGNSKGTKPTVGLPKSEGMEREYPKGIKPTSPPQKNTDSATMQVNPNEVHLDAPKTDTMKTNSAHTQSSPNMDGLINGELIDRELSAKSQIAHRAAQPVPVGSVRPATSHVIYPDLRHKKKVVILPSSLSRKPCQDSAKGESSRIIAENVDKNSGMPSSPVTYPDSRQKKNAALSPPSLIHKPIQDSKTAVLFPPSLIRKPSQDSAKGESSSSIVPISALAQIFGVRSSQIQTITYGDPIKTAQNMSFGQNEKCVNVANITKPLMSGTGLRPHSAQKTSPNQNRKRVNSAEFDKLLELGTSLKPNADPSNSNKAHANNNLVRDIFKIVRNTNSNQESKIKVLKFEKDNTIETVETVENVHKKISDENVTRNVDATQEKVKAIQSKLVQIAPKKIVDLLPDDPSKGSTYSQLLLERALPGIPCVWCGRGFPTEHRHAAHSDTASNVSYRCAQCHQIYSDRCTFTAHICGKTTNGKVNCANCKGTFTQIGFQNHKRRKLQVGSGGRNVQGKQSCARKCEECGILFNTLETLQAHLLTHLDVRVPQKCPCCDKTFRYIAEVQQHMYLDHLNQDQNTHLPSHTCSICSNKSFWTAEGLRKHCMRAHGGADPTYRCKLCGRIYWDMALWVKHVPVCKKALKNVEGVKQARVAIKRLSHREILEHGGKVPRRN